MVAILVSCFFFLALWRTTHVHIPIGLFSGSAWHLLLHVRCIICTAVLWSASTNSAFAATTAFWLFDSLLINLWVWSRKRLTARWSTKIHGIVRFGCVLSSRQI